MDGYGDNNSYKEIVKHLFETPLHDAVHEQIVLEDIHDGLAWASQLKEHLWAYDHFSDFYQHVNRLHKPDELYDIGPWRLVQQSDPFINMAGIEDGPVAGLRYRIFYNSYDSGELEIEPILTSEEAPVDIRFANLFINIFPAPLLPHEHIKSLLSVCTIPFDRYKNRDYRQPYQDAITAALAETLWESNRKDSIWVALNFDYSGAVNLHHKPK